MWHDCHEDKTQLDKQSGTNTKMRTCFGVLRFGDISDCATASSSKSIILDILVVEWLLNYPESRKVSEYDRHLMCLWWAGRHKLPYTYCLAEGSFSFLEVVLPPKAVLVVARSWHQLPAFYISYWVHCWYSLTYVWPSSLFTTSNSQLGQTAPNRTSIKITVCHHPFFTYFSHFEKSKSPLYSTPVHHDGNRF